MKQLQFTKMQALGNDFMIIDQTQNNYQLDKQAITELANRKTGVGFDQLLINSNNTNPKADFYCSIFNADGSEVGQCGNGIRCFARFVYEQGLTDKKHLKIATNTGLIVADILDDKRVKIDMGLVKFTPKLVPYLSDKEQITYQINSYKFGISNVGNPHCTLLVDDVKTAKVDKIGYFLMKHLRFPKQVNVGFMQIVNKNEILLRVYERGVGETQACGSGACAAVSYGSRLGQLESDVKVHLPGGDLQIKYQLDQNIIMEGEAVFVYKGEIG